MNWRVPRAGLSGLEEDANNVCLAADRDVQEVFHWYLPIAAITCENLEHLRFYVSYYSSCGREVPSATYDLTVRVDDGQILGEVMQRSIELGGRDSYSLPDLLGVDEC